jgi:Flp pilus assembly protein TadG
MRTSTPTRGGSVLPLMAVSLVAVFGFVALAIDLGMVALARTQYQNAADAAAMAGARTLDGTASGNVSAATANATSAAIANTILSGTIPAGQVAVQHGAYHYNNSNQSFVPQLPAVAPDNYNLTQVTIAGSASTAFARVLNLTSTNLTVTSQAAYRPRDVAIVLDFSGSMNNESDLWNCESYLGTMVNTPNNTDPVYPQFGVYNPAFSPQAQLQCTSTDPRVGLCNITQTISGVPALVNDFYQNSRGASAAGAFGAPGSSVTNTTPGGDNYLNAKSGGSPAVTWQDITGSASTTFAGYPSFNGYTQGPGSWGKTFFLWPPDPNPANDWRKKFFTLPGGGTLNSDQALWDSGGNWLDPPGNYTINYAAILNWIQNSPNSPFPSVLRAGSILYYDQIPSDVPASAYDHTQPNSNISDPNQRFWKEYIDFVLGVWRDPFGNVQHPGSSTCSYGPDFACGSGAPVQITGPDAPPSGGGAAWIDPLDNPLRPRHRFWFGPMTMIQYMLDTGLLPGTAHDISMIPAKMGISGALQDIQNNHPNDLVSIWCTAGRRFRAIRSARPIFRLRNRASATITPACSTACGIRRIAARPMPALGTRTG